MVSEAKKDDVFIMKPVASGKIFYPSLWEGNQAYQPKEQIEEKPKLSGVRIHQQSPSHQRLQVRPETIRSGDQLRPSKNIYLLRGALPFCHRDLRHKKNTSTVFAPD